MHTQLSTRSTVSAARSLPSSSLREREADFSAAIRTVMTRTNGRPSVGDLMGLGDHWMSDHLCLSSSAEVLVRWNNSDQPVQRRRRSAESTNRSSAECPREV